MKPVFILAVLVCAAVVAGKDASNPETHQLSSNFSAISNHSQCELPVTFTGRDLLID